MQLNFCFIIQKLKSKSEFQKMIAESKVVQAIE